MKNTEEKSLIVKKENVFNKIIMFFRNSFSRGKIQVESIPESKITNKIDLNKEKFESNIKLDEKKQKLLKIQNELTNKGINSENLLRLTKNLTQAEMKQLKELYIEQNKRLNEQLDMYKNKILILKKQI